MVASPRQRLILPLAPTGAGMVGVLTALLFAVMPSGTLESIVVDSGIAALFNAAQPPLGLTARALLALVGGGLVSVLAWVALFVAVGTRSVIVQNPRATGGEGPTLRRADVHPDAPPRQPVFANRDLGTPFLQVRAEAVPSAAAPNNAVAERALPADLDMPLAEFDPQSFASPLAPPAPVPEQIQAEPADAPLPIRRDSQSVLDRIAASMEHAPSPPVLAALGETPESAPIHRTEPVVAPFLVRRDTRPAMDRISTSMQQAASPPREDRAEPLEAAMPIRLDTGRAIDLIAASMQQPPAKPVEADSPASIRALLDRLERSVAQREVAVQSAPTRQEQQESIRGTLETLRGLATRAG